MGKQMIHNFAGLKLRTGIWRALMNHTEGKRRPSDPRGFKEQFPYSRLAGMHNVGPSYIQEIAFELAKHGLILTGYRKSVPLKINPETAAKKAIDDLYADPTISWSDKLDILQRIESYARDMKGNAHDEIDRGEA